MKRAREGFVLVSVLWVVALLTVITLSYHHRARLEVQAARYSLDSSQAMMAARGAVERGIVDLRNKSMLGQFVITPGVTPGAPLTYHGQFWARGGDLSAPGEPLEASEEFQDDFVHYSIEDLERFVSINSAPEELVENLPGISLPVARQINFRRGGVDESGEAAESTAVAFQDIAELRGLRGISEEDWHGTEEEPGLRHLLTTFGDGRLNVNTAPIEVLRLLPGVGEEGAASILNVRNGPDGVSGTADDLGWNAWDAFAMATGLSGDALQSLQQLCKFDSSYFKIEAVATRRAGKIRSACAAVIHVTGESGDATLVSWTEESLGAQ
jgi:type II secretory pathway component PulK